MMKREDERIRADVSERLSTELPDDAVPMQVDVRMAKSRWPAPSIPLKPGAGPKGPPRALRAWSLS
jgi:hypothetical protein